MFGIILFEVFGLLLSFGGLVIANNYIDIANYLHIVLGNMGLMTKAEGTYNLIDGMRVMAQIGREVSWLQYCVYCAGLVIIAVGVFTIIVSSCSYIFGIIRSIFNNKRELNN